jgi:2-hydroxy-6-oxonona-2,4-dienedioate hydrolase
VALTEEQLVHVPGLLSRWVRLPTGARAHFVTAGESGPAVVLLHGGFMGSSGTAGFRYMAPFLGSHGFQVYCPDMPSFGLTSDPDGAYDYGEAGHVDFLHDFVDALCLDRFHLGGNSMGCTNTAYYLVTHPERVVSFAMIAGGIGDLADGATDPRPPQERPAIPSFDGTTATMRQALEVILFDTESLDDDVVAMRTHAANRQRESYERFRESWLANLRGQGDVNLAARLRTKGRLDRLTIPGIYLHGLQDVLSPVDIGYAHERVLPGVQFFYPDETGHQGQTDRPDLFNQVFLEFFRDGRVSADTARAAGVSDRRPPIDALVDRA